MSPRVLSVRSLTEYWYSLETVISLLVWILTICSSVLHVYVHNFERHQIDK